MDARTIPHAILHVTTFGFLVTVDVDDFDGRCGGAPGMGLCRGDGLMLVAPQEGCRWVQSQQRSPYTLAVSHNERNLEAWRLALARLAETASSTTAILV